jgi:uncharacterized protein
MSISNKIKKFVEEECKKPSSKYGEEPFEHHITPMVNYAKKLAQEAGADEEIVEVAAWLHDIGSIMKGRKDHHITGSEIAEEKLKELNYPAEKIAKIKLCILNHRGSLNNPRNTKEEQVIAEADALSNFDNVPGIFNAALVFEKQNQIQARKSTVEKLANKWNQLSEKGKSIVEKKYEAAKILFT